MRGALVKREYVAFCKSGGNLIDFFGVMQYNSGNKGFLESERKNKRFFQSYKGGLCLFQTTLNI